MSVTIFFFWYMKLVHETESLKLDSNHSVNFGRLFVIFTHLKLTVGSLYGAVYLGLVSLSNLFALLSLGHHDKSIPSKSVRF